MKTEWYSLTAVLAVQGLMGLEGADSQIAKAVAAAVARQPVGDAMPHQPSSSITWDKLIIIIARCTQVCRSAGSSCTFATALQNNVLYWNTANSKNL